LPRWNDEDDTKSQVLSGALGEESPFDRTFGFHVAGASLRTPIDPEGWRDRLVAVSTPAMTGATALFMEPHDVCAAKLCAGREHDVTFVCALVRAGLVDPRTLVERVEATDVTEEARQRALAVIAGC
jgi:hypothetical protein